MADPVDLVCNEVIVEEQIEPAKPVASVADNSKKHVSKRSSSQLLHTSQEEEECSGVCVARSLEGRKRFGHGKRRKFGDAVTTSEFRYARGQDEVFGEWRTKQCEDAFHEMLPSEIRWGILSRLSQSELLPLRRVSRAWRKTIDAFIKVDVKIQGDSPDFRGKCDLPMKTCRLVSLQNPSHRHLFKSPVPEKVKIIRGICSLNFEELVLQWANLTKLELCWRTTMRNLLFGKKALERSLSTRTILPSLTSLTLEMLINDSLGKRTQLRIRSNVTNLTSYDYPSLTNFRIIFMGYRELHSGNRHLQVLLPFISRHAISLCSIDVILRYTSHVVYPPAHPRHILFCVPANIQTNYRTPHSSSEGHLTTTQLRRLDSTPAHQLEWVNMLKNTRQLEVAIMTRFLNWSIKHLDFFAPTITRYSKFLRRVDIMNVTMYDSGAHNTVTQLDAKIFRDCSQLAELRFYRAPIIFHEEEIDPPTELINLHHLPNTLQELVIDGLPVSSLEILATITDCVNLKSFHYFQSQVPRRNMLWSNGINWEILQCVIKHPALNSVKVHVTTVGQVPSHTQYEGHLKRLAKEYGWSTNGIVPGYMNMFQITLTKPK